MDHIHLKPRLHLTNFKVMYKKLIYV